MGLAAAAFDRGRRLVLRDQARRQIEQPFREHASALGELLRVSHHRDVVLHVLVRPAARMGDKRELRKHEAELSEEAQHLAGNHLDIVLTADDDEARNLVTNEDAVRNRDLVLDAVHSLGHLEIERRCGSPANRRRDDDCIRPMHESVVDAVELILCVHLRDRAGPSAGLRRLRVVTLAGAELEIVEPNEPRLGAEVSRRLERKAEQMVGARETRVGHIHDRRRDAGEAQRPGRALGPLRLAGISTTVMDMANPRFSGSDHLLGLALKAAADFGAETRLIRLNDLKFRACEGYYSKAAQACTWPCSITQMDAKDELDR